MRATPRIGVIDSGVAEPAASALAAGRRFRFGEDGRMCWMDGVADRLGHGGAVTGEIRGLAPAAAMLHAQVFDRSFRTAPALVAAALDWLVAEGVDVVNMSFGLPADRAVLGSACRRAAQSGTLLVAAAPARGAACYPAAYADVVAVTGDARCVRGEVSDLQGVQADFGAWCASPERGGGRIAGASLAAAHFTGLAGAFLACHSGAGRDEVLAHFRATAVHVGPERRGMTAAIS